MPTDEHKQAVKKLESLRREVELVRGMPQVDEERLEQIDSMLSRLRREATIERRRVSRAH